MPLTDNEKKRMRAEVNGEQKAGVKATPQLVSSLASPSERC
jgi:hypothetical protein